MKTQPSLAKNETSDNILKFKWLYEIPYDATCKVCNLIKQLPLKR